MSSPLPNSALLRQTDKPKFESPKTFTVTSPKKENGKLSLPVFGSVLYFRTLLRCDFWCDPGNPATADYWLRHCSSGAGCLSALLADEQETKGITLRNDPPHLGRVLLYPHSADSKFDSGHNLRKSQIFGIILVESERRKVVWRNLRFSAPPQSKLRSEISLVSVLISILISRTYK